MRCSIGVLELPDGLVIDDIGRVSAAIAAVKAQAKTSQDGIDIMRFGQAPEGEGETIAS